MAELKLRYNQETEEAEVTVDGEVLISSGPDVFASWVEHYNNAHPAPPASDAPVSVEEPVESKKVEPSGPVEKEPEEVAQEVDSPPAPVVD